MPVDKPDETGKSDANESDELNKAGNDKPKPPEPAKDATGDLQNKGVLPGARIELAPGIAVGDKVNHNNESWIAKGTHEGKGIVFQEGRGKSFAGEFRVIEGQPDPKEFKEIPRFDGQEKDTRYFSDKTGGVWKMQSMADGKALMLTAHDIKLVDPKELELAEKPADAKAADVKAGDTKAADTKAAETPAKPEIKVGDKVDYQGDRLKVGAILEDKAVLYEQGRHASYALLMKQVTDAELKTNYQEVKVNVDGKETTRYVSKGANPLVYQVLEMGGEKKLFRDHSMEVASKDSLGKDATKDRAGVPKDRGTDTTSDKTAPPTPDKPAPVDASKLPKPGTEVDHKGEKLNVTRYEGDYALLHKTGRNSSYAISPEPVTDAVLKEKYQNVKVNIDGKTESRYIEKGHPEKGVYDLMNLGGGKQLYRDHAFEVVPTKELEGQTGKQVVPSRRPAERVEPKADPKQNAADRTIIIDGPPEAKIRPGVDSKGEKADERIANVNGKEVKIRTPQDELWKHMTREVEIDGKVVKLHRVDPPRAGQSWYYSDRSPVPGDKSAEQVKLHVTGIDAKDLARLQTELLPELEKMLQKGDIRQYKTFDPNFMDGKWQDNPDRYGKGPRPEGQGSKAFTIYVPPEKAEEVGKVIDKLLKDKGLTLKGYEGDNVGEKQRLQSESKRVSVERDMWPTTKDSSNRDGALLDEALAKKIHERYSKSHGVDSEGRLKPEALRAAEKAAGIERGQLHYDVNGKLMFLDGNYESEKHDSKRFYADESAANKTKGELTGRPALYALYEQEKMDPAKVFTEQVKAEPLAYKREAAKMERPERVAPKADKLQGSETRVANDGTIEKKDARPGEVLAREQLERRERVEQKEIDEMKREVEKLAKSDKEAEREKAKAMKQVVEALEGKHGPEAQALAHREVLAESKKALERGEGGGYGRAVTGGLIGVGILAVAALSYYNRQQRLREEKEKELDRAKVK